MQKQKSINSVKYGINQYRINIAVLPQNYDSNYEKY